MRGQASRLITVIMVLLLMVVFSGRAQAGQIKSGIFGLWGWGNWSDAFNLVSSNQFDLAVSITTGAELDMAQSVGMKCLVSFGLTSQIASDPTQWQNYLANLKTTVANFKSHPAVYAWYPVDEPDWQGIPTDKIKTVREVIRSIDTSKPIFTVLGNRQQWIKYLPFFDIISVDPYLTTTVPGTTDQPSIVRDYLRQMKADMKKAKLRRPLWLTVGAFAAIPRDPAAVATYLTPTPAQFNQMVDIGVQEGVDAILVYTLSFTGSTTYYDWKLPLDNPALWDAVRSMPGTLKALP